MNQPKQVGRKVKMLTLVAACIGYFMVILDTTVVNVTLPKIQQNLSANVSGLQWVVDAYILVFASLLLSGGALNDRLGGKRIFKAGLMMFTAASALCGAAPTLGLLIVARGLQGIGTALIVPSSLSLLSHIFAEPAEKAKAVGIYAAVTSIAQAAGPLVGGFFVDVLGWRSIFYINVPIGILGFFLTTRFVSETSRSKARGLDLVAQIIGIIALCSLTFALIDGGAKGWGSPLIVGAFGAFILATAAFITLERYSRSPMLPLQLFANPAFSAATGVGLMRNLGYYGQLFLLSLFFQQVQGYSALGTGAAFLPLTATIAPGSLLAGRLYERIGPRLLIAVGLALSSISALAMALINAKTSYASICGMLITAGFGIGLSSPPMMAALLANAPEEQSGIAGGIFNTSLQVGSLFGVALLGSFVSNRHSFVHGMHIAFVIAGAALLSGCFITLRFVQCRLVTS